MELSVLERLMLFNMLPTEGNFGTLRMARRLKEELELTVEEQKQIGFVRKGSEFAWERELEPAKVFEIDELMHAMIVERLQDLDARQKLTMQHYSLYERFVEE